MRLRLRLFVADEYKPLRLVPPLLWVITLGALCAQIVLTVLLVPPPEVRREDYANPPPLELWHIAALGEPETLAKVVAIRLQTFDNQPGISIPFAELDYVKIGLWLDNVVAMDERAEYPHFLMSKVYSFVPEPSRRRLTAEWVWRQFLRDPAHRWWWMTHSVSYARHVLKDKELALKMARDLRIHLKPGDGPSWPRQMEAYLLEGQSEFDSAATILLNQLEAGEITDPQEFSFLLERLEGILRKMYEEGELTSRAQAEEKLQALQQLQDKFLQQHGITE